MPGKKDIMEAKPVWTITKETVVSTLTTGGTLPLLEAAGPYILSDFMESDQHRVITYRVGEFRVDVSRPDWIPSDID